MKLEGNNIEVEYGIDRNADAFFTDIDVLSLDDSLADVDAVVVTAITYFDEIRKALCCKVDCPIISLEDIINEML